MTDQQNNSNNYKSRTSDVDSSWSLRLLKNVFARALKSSNYVPKHIGFVMDGNRRFAKKYDIEIKEGHEAGFVSMGKILELCYESGVKATTVFAFSIENFNRSSAEVDNLMSLARDKIRQIVENGELAEKYGIRIRVIGDLSLLPTKVLKDIEAAIDLTKNNKRATLNICFPYTGRQEIFHSIKSVVEDKENNDMITEQTIDSNLYTSGLPPLDLMIRSSGVSRLSDFLLWQVCNKGVSIKFVDCLWPEFTPLKMAWLLMTFVYEKSILQHISSVKLSEEFDGENKNNYDDEYSYIKDDDSSSQDEENGTEYSNKKMK